MYFSPCTQAESSAENATTAENGVWLPWISAAFIEPMLRLNDTFGQMSTLTLTKKYDPDTLRKMLNGN